MIVYISDPQNSTRELLKLTNTFSDVARYKINAKTPTNQKPVFLLCTNDKEAEEEIRNITFYNSQK